MFKVTYKAGLTHRRQNVYDFYRSRLCVKARYSSRRPVSDCLSQTRKETAYHTSFPPDRPVILVFFEPNSRYQMPTLSGVLNVRGVVHFVHVTNCFYDYDYKIANISIFAIL